jgi:hypothetical protein
LAAHLGSIAVPGEEQQQEEEGLEQQREQELVLAWGLEGACRQISNGRASLEAVMTLELWPVVVVVVALVVQLQVLAVGLELALAL